MSTKILATFLLLIGALLVPAGRAQAYDIPVYTNGVDQDDVGVAASGRLLTDRFVYTGPTGTTTLIRVLPAPGSQAVSSNDCIYATSFLSGSDGVNGVTQYIGSGAPTPYCDLAWANSGGSQSYLVNGMTYDWSAAFSGASAAFVGQEFGEDTAGSQTTSYTDFNYGSVGVSEVYFTLYQYSPSPPVPPPTTEWAEVINYIPQTAFSTTTGVTNVGAVFSIPAASSVSYVGYRLFTPNNQVIYNATTSTATEGTYEIVLPINFADAGAWTGHAYFGQQVGDDPENIWEVDNITIQQILVDVEEWSVSPDGEFTQNPATTSTTTLSNLNLDCGEGFAGSVCNLVARVFIPSAASIGLVQTSWAAVLNKAPFSFFTESRLVLQSLTATNGTQQSLVITIFDTNLQVISTSSAAFVGLDVSQINFLKFLMIVGLWILFAWFLYWRVASIFGV